MCASVHRSYSTSPRHSGIDSRLRPYSDSNNRREALEKLQQSLTRLLRPFFQHPMPGILQYNNRDIGRD